MSGHSKWANIKHKKGKADAVRGKIFTKLGREIAIAVKEGGGDPAVNNKLRDIIAKAKANNMPNDTLLRSIKKAAGEMGGVTYKEITYEGYAPGGVAVIVECLTDNLNRAASEIRHAFDKNDGSLGATGCVSFSFDRVGLLVVERRPGVEEDDMLMTALDAGAQDMQTLDDAFEIYTAPSDFSVVREALEQGGHDFLSAEITMIPQNTVQVTDADVLAKVIKMLDMLDDLDDVQQVYHNAELPEEDEDDD